MRDVDAVGEVGVLLEASLPPEQPHVLVHGDYRLGNVMFAPGPPVRLLAILDWETITLGDPLADLGFLLATYPAAGEPDDAMVALHAVARRPGFPTRRELLDRYAARSTRSVERIDWYTAYGLWRVAIQL